MYSGKENSEKTYEAVDTDYLPDREDVDQVEEAEKPLSSGKNVGDTGGQDIPRHREKVSLPTLAVLGNYCVLRGAAVLGGGGQAKVYDCFFIGEENDMSAIPLVAKLYPLENEKPKVIEKIREVNEKIKGLRHPYLEEIFAHGFSDNGKYYMVVMRKYEPCDKDFLQIRAFEEDMGKSQTRFMREVEGMCEALGKLHQEGIYHGDIKPDNVMLYRESNGRKHLVLIDFGAGVITMESGNMRGKSVIATAVSRGYTAPELVNGRRAKISPWTDYYSFGLTIAELVAGVYPKKSDLLDEKTKSEKDYLNLNRESANDFYGVLLPAVLPAHLAVFFKCTLHYDINGDNKRRWITQEVREWTEAVRREDYERAAHMEIRGGSGKESGSGRTEQPEQPYSVRQPRTEIVVTYDGESPLKIYSTEEMAEMFLQHWDMTIEYLLRNDRWTRNFNKFGEDVTNLFDETKKKMRAAGSVVEREEIFDKMIMETYLSDRIKKEQLRYHDICYTDPVKFGNTLYFMLLQEKKDTNGKYRLPNGKGSEDEVRDLFVKTTEMFASGTVEKFFQSHRESWEIDEQSVQMAAAIRKNIQSGGKNKQAKTAFIENLYRLSFRLRGKAGLRVLGNDFEDYGAFLHHLRKQYKKGTDIPFKAQRKCFTEDGRLRIDYYAFLMEASGVVEKPSRDSLEMLA